MSARFTLGIEEEFQLVDRYTGQLCSHIQTILEKGASIFGDKIKPEMLQSTVEVVTDVCPNITAARMELQQLRAMLLNVVEEEGLTLISAGTHPSGSWHDQVSMPNERYAELEEELQDIARSILIFGLHVHVGVESNEIAAALINQLRTWIPHLLALSANSPFWSGRFTGIKSYRSVVWRPFPRSGVPEIFSSYAEYEGYVQALISAGIIDNAKKIWWDIRPHPFFRTVEFRVFDMPGTIEDSVALAALCQALVAKLTWLYKRGLSVHVLPRYFVDENKWRAMRYGLDAEIVDFVQGHRVPMRDALHNLLDFVDDVLDDLGSRREISYLRRLIDDPRGTGADRQIAIYRQTGSIHAVTRYLMAQTVQGLQVDSAEQTLAS
ncbi:MAG TPA: carboxylate-amine ligase [Ktedonobacteraceae bacterium]|jgi:carboxylate-amine ligase|nr:carboxylate-amine ligase [Ktedonobacteraceae bacterium]